ncbi:transporter substrate-binding domain-containing protein [Taylorella asinigenitalis]|uniref:Lysine-arginine-ornithine-binding periplasmic protein n=1 Tax=Taylorella asinigenitalis (strain MCE3) TaxID=1008459 RepID=G4QD13_TAYAM|nr:transporter substrate-binding domain-containing protein [Taylorella asinigenitalis]AEP35830.1 Lysine-arginine-ornithine-binding periplasmic protein precursor [Taylorella asinigenitalis MCE3]
MRSLLLTAGLVLGLASVAQAKDFTELRIGTESGYVPFEYKNEKGELIGFDIEVGNAICEKLKAKCTWVEQPFDALIPGLQARKFDIIHASITHNEAREKVIDFTDDVYAIPTQLIAKKGSGIVTEDDLKGKRLGALQGSAQEAYARRVISKKDVKVVSYKEQPQTFIDLKAGRIDAAIVEKPNANSAFIATPEGADYEFVGQPLEHELLNNRISIGLRKGDKDLKEALDKAIAELRAEGKIAEIAKKYFKEGELDLLDKK